MKIKLIPVGNGSPFTFPALPEKIKGKEAAKIQSFEIISQGVVKVPKGTDSIEISWEAEFFGKSKRNEVIVQPGEWRDPLECINILRNFYTNGTVLNLIVTETWINLDVVIVSFQPEAYGAYGNVKYSITFAQKKPLVIYDTNELKIAAFVRKTKPRNDSGGGAAPSKGTYTVKSGDTLSGIAQRKCGGASKWPALYNANASVIESTAKRRGMSSSDHGHWIFPGTTLVLV